MIALTPARQSRGMSLIGLMISVAIVGILASIAYPSYEAQMQKSRRADAINALTDLANRMERYYTRTNAYNTATINVASSTDVLASAATVDAAGVSGFEPLGPQPLRGMSGTIDVFQLVDPVA